MKTAIAVEDGKLTNEQLGALHRRVNELTRRMNEGTLGFDSVMDELQRVVEGRTAGEPRQWNVWKTIKLGTGLKTPDDFRKALKKNGHNVSDWANDILGKPAFTASDTEMDADLVDVSVGDLGFKNGATRADIYARAQELGLQLCPNEVGPQLRLQYTDQPRGEWLIIGMEPITGSGGGLRLFRVERYGDGKQWLHTDCSRTGYVWRADYRFVFLRRK